MSYILRESELKDKNLISDLNEELKKNEILFQIPLPRDNESNKNDFIYMQNFVLFENENSIKGAYSLKNQLFKINNSLLRIGFYANPVSAGLFNKKYNICGVLLLNDANKRSPNIFCLGMGSYENSLPKLLKGLSWNFKTIPFYFKVYKPYNFLKNIAYLKDNKIKSFILFILNFSGAGWIFIKLLNFFNYLFNFRFNKKMNIDVNEVSEFDDSVKYIWDNVNNFYIFTAVRNDVYLKSLYSSKKFIKLRFSHNNKVVGWSISLCSELSNHKQFGSMKLGSIVDCFSLKNYESIIIEKTSELLKKKQVDLVVSNQSHIFWKKAFIKNSFIRGPSNFIFSPSKELSKKLNQNIKNNDFFHITRGDGDGPINL